MTGKVQCHCNSASESLRKDAVVSFGVVGKPVQWRIGRTRRGRTYVPTEVQSYRNLLALSATAAKPASWNKDNRYALEIVVHYRDGKRRDLENLISVVQDALNGIVWADDSQIDDVRAVRGEVRTEGEVWVNVRDLRKMESETGVMTTPNFARPPAKRPRRE